jgi:YVTN family beta-propeller protein
MNGYSFFTKIRLVWVCISLILLQACGGTTPPEAVNTPTAVSTVIGPLGGTVTGPDGVQVVIPPGALSKSTAIGIAKSSVGAPSVPTAYPLGGAVYEFTPHDIVFTVPVTIRMPVPSGASGTGVFMASAGETWGLKDAYNNQGMAEFERNSFSWGYIGADGCSYNRNDPNLDPSGCITRSGYATASALTPTAALTRNQAPNAPTTSPIPSAGSYTLNQAATVQLKLAYKAGENCSNNTVTINRRELDVNGPGTVGPSQILLNAAAVSMTPSGGNAPFRSASGNTTLTVAFTSADSGKKYWFGLVHTCSKPAEPATSYGDGLVIVVATLAPPAVTYTVGGSVSGLTSAGLVLQNNGADNLTVSADGTFTFAAAAAAGDPYNLTILTQPSGQTCTVTNGGGTVQGNVVNVAVTCVAATSYLVYPVGGYASYLNKGAVVLQNVSPAGTETITVNADNFFTFPTKILSGSPYNVTVVTAPAGQTCTVLYGNGTSSASNRKIDVTCTDIPPAKLALVANGGDNTLSVYSADGTTGALTALGTASAGAEPSSISMEECGRFAFVANRAANSVSSYAISAANSTATLVANSGIYSPSPFGIAIQPGCRGHVWVVNNSANTVSTYAYDSVTGLLSANATVASGLSPSALAVDIGGYYLYAANEAGNSVSAYKVDGFYNGNGTGALTPVANTLTYSILSPRSLVVDPSGKFLYVASSGDNRVLTFSIDRSTGALSSVTGTVSTGSSPNGIAVHPTGQFLYTANSGSNDISIFSIDSLTGVLTAVGAPISAGAAPTGLVIGLGGKVLYVTNKSANSTSVFSINTSTGALTSLGTAVGTGAGPIGIAITP